MIRVTVELLSAIDGHQEILGEGVIYNDATGTDTRGNYKFILSKKGGLKEGRRARYSNIWKQGEVKNFPRQRLGGWALLARALEEASGVRYSGE